MNQSNPQNEPTMDEILASIRKIISEDQPEAEDESSAPASSGEPQPASSVRTSMPVYGGGALDEEPDDKASELHEEFSEPNEATDFADVPSFRPVEDDLPEDYGTDVTGDDFISASTREALDHAFDRLDEPDDEPLAATPPSNASIEAVFARAVQEAFEPTLQSWVEGHREEIVDRLAPLIREWMDENLPPLIEAAVSKEIARAVRSRRR